MYYEKVGEIKRGEEERRGDEKEEEGYGGSNATKDGWIWGKMK